MFSDPKFGGLDEHTPNIARMYDYFLGDSTNFAADRAAAEQLLRVFPGNTEWAHSNGYGAVGILN